VKGRRDESHVTRIERGRPRSQPALSALATSITDAVARLRAYAFANDLRLTDVSRGIVARRLRLRPDANSSKDGEA
jgi:hypothetical protein